MDTKPNVIRPTIAAMLVNYNHAAHLSQALQSILGQTIPFDEILIIDDGSTDNSVAVIESHLHKAPEARLLRNPSNIGVVATVNAGVEHITSDFIFFFAADDTYSLHLVEWFRAFMQQYPATVMITANSLIHDVSSGISQPCILPYPQHAAFYSGDYLDPIGKKRALTFFGGPGMFKRDAVRDAGGYIADLRWHADWFLCLILSRRHGFGYIPEQFATFHIANSQYSHGRHDWAQQKSVITAMLQLLRGPYASEYTFFRQCAVLPTYDFQTLVLLLTNREFRDYLTPLLVWRLLTYKPLRSLAKLVPQSLRATIRKSLRV